MRSQFFSTTLTFIPTTTSITLLPGSPSSTTSTIKGDKKIANITSPKTLNDLPIRLMPLIFQSLPAASVGALACTNRRMYVAYKSCTITIPPPLPTVMWSIYTDIANGRRMILDGPESMEIKKMVLEYKSRMVRDRIREDKGLLGLDVPGSKIIFEKRRMAQWNNVQKQLKRAELREQQKVEMQQLAKVEEEEKAKKMSRGRVLAWFQLQRG